MSSRYAPLADLFDKIQTSTDPKDIGLFLKACDEHLPSLLIEHAAMEERLKVNGNKIPKCRDLTMWKPARGKAIPIKDLEQNHLEAILNMLRRSWRDHPQLRALEKEYDSRKTPSSYRPKGGWTRFG